MKSFDAILQVILFKLSLIPMMGRLSPSGKVSRVGALPGVLATQSNQLLPVCYESVLFGNSYGYDPTIPKLFFYTRSFKLVPLSNGEQGGGTPRRPGSQTKPVVTSVLRKRTIRLHLLLRLRPDSYALYFCTRGASRIVPL